MQTAISKVNVWLAYLDIDECAIGTHSCNADAECNNIKGSHNCQCNSLHVRFTAKWIVTCKYTHIYDHYF